MYGIINVLKCLPLNLQALLEFICKKQDLHSKFKEYELQDQKNLGV